MEKRKSIELIELVNFNYLGQSFSEHSLDIIAEEKSWKRIQHVGIFGDFEIFT